MAASVVAGLLGAMAPGAQAADYLRGGQIAVSDADSVPGAPGVLKLVNADGTGKRTIPGLENYGEGAGWAPDGSRLAAVGRLDQLITGRASGPVNPVTLPSDLMFGGTGHPTYWLDGRYIVFSSAARELVYLPSDGSGGPQRLLTEAQEPLETIWDNNPTSSPTGVLAFDRREFVANPPHSESRGIWTFDPAAEELKQVIADGSDPAYSANGSKLAFMRRVGDVEQVFTANADGSDIRQVTHEPKPSGEPSGENQQYFSSPTWDPEGGRIAYTRNAREFWDRVLRTVDLATGDTRDVTSGRMPSWQPLRLNQLARVYGTGSVGIDGAASRWTFDQLGTAHVPGLLTARSAVLTNKTQGTYAAAGVALASEKQGPLLYTSGTGLDSAAATELKKVLPKGSTIYLNGGTNLLSSRIYSQVQALGYKPLRLEAGDVAAQSVRVAQQISRAPSWVFVVDGLEYHDPIAAGAAAGALGYRGTGVVLFTRGTSTTNPVRSYLNALDPTKTSVVTVGANATTAFRNAPLTKSWEYWDVKGANHEETAANLARFWWTSPTATNVLDTWSWQNGAAGAATNGVFGPVLWSTRASLSPATATYLNQCSASVSSVMTYGGNVSYPTAERDAIRNNIAADTAWTSTQWFPNGEPQATTDTFRSQATPTARTGTGTGTTGMLAQHLPRPNRHTAS